MDKSSPRDIPLKDLLLIVGDYLKESLRYWWVCLILGLLLGGYLGWTARSTELTYVAPITFALNNTSGGGGVGSLLGQFGFDAGGGSNASPDKILALAKSQKIIHTVLLDSVDVDDQRDRIANHLIKIYDLQLEWNLSGDPQKIIRGNIAEMRKEERALLKRLHSFVLSDVDNIIRINFDKKTDIIRLTSQTLKEDLSLAITLSLYDKLSSFYTQESTGSSRASVEKLRYKADSVANALAEVEYQLAAAQDTRLDIQQQRGLLRQAQLSRQVQILGLSYAEILRNLETADFALSSRTPFFQTIDVPFTPLYRDKPNWKLQLVYGGIGGVFLGVLLISMLKFYRSVMAN